MNEVFSDVANLIKIREFLLKSIDDMSIKLSKEQVKAIQSRVALLNEKIVTGALTMTVLDINSTKVGRTFTSTEDVNEVMSRIKPQKEAKVKHSSSATEANNSK
jgi:hypothetical protein